MILRSIGKTINNKKKLANFKRNLFIVIESLINLMENKRLTDADIIDSISYLKSRFGISFGQTQKGINVVLKYHYRLNEGKFKSCASILHCPLDSVVMKSLGESKKSLNSVNKKKYVDLQLKILEMNKVIGKYKIDYDDIWDIQNLKRNKIFR